MNANNASNDESNDAEHGPLSGKTIAILATHGVEQLELEQPRAAFEAAGATTVLIAPKGGKIQAFKHHDRGDELSVELELKNADPGDFDGLLLPGGTLNADALRVVPEAVLFVRAFAVSGRPIAAICHGPWLLIESDSVRGRQITSWPSLRTDLENAGATWVNEAVVVDAGIVTSRKPSDILAFVEKAIEEFAEGGQQKAADSQSFRKDEERQSGGLGRPRSREAKRV